MARRLDTRDADFDAQLGALLDRTYAAPAEADRVAATILADIRARGDQALAACCQRYEGWDPAAAGGFRMDPAAIERGAGRAAPAVRAALARAAARIRAYHARQLPEDAFWADGAGVELGWRWRPVDSVGVYVPGGRARYPSSVLMSAIPARVAGVERVVITTPCGGGDPDPLVLEAARLAGVSEIYRIGGAQAVAALAYGTESVGAVDLVVGPGNAYVTAAKRRLSGVVGLDAPAGPSELLIIADGNNDPTHLASDLLAQAEHDPLAQSVLVTDDPELAQRVAEAVEAVLARLPAADVARQSWQDRGAIVRVGAWEEAVAIANRMAPEHLQVCTPDSQRIAESVRHAGAVFLSSGTPEVFGDYLAGPSHVLPTNGAARHASGLSVLTFLKRTSLMRCGAGARADLARDAAILARAEGLEAHALSAEARGTVPGQ